MNPLRALGRDLEAVNHDVVLAALEAGDQTVPLVLNESRLPAHTRGQRICEIDLEADQVCGISRVRKRVWSAALGVGGPHKLLSGSGRSRKQQKGNTKAGNSFHDFPTLQ